MQAMEHRAAARLLCVADYHVGRVELEVDLSPPIVGRESRSLMSDGRAWERHRAAACQSTPAAAPGVARITTASKRVMSSMQAAWTGAYAVFWRS